jgi:hypothetical protein
MVDDDAIGCEVTQRLDAGLRVVTWPERDIGHGRLTGAVAYHTVDGASDEYDIGATLPQRLGQRQ